VRITHLVLDNNIKFDKDEPRMISRFFFWGFPFGEKKKKFQVILKHRKWSPRKDQSVELCIIKRMSLV
jgi:hypothetical protein